MSQCAYATLGGEARSNISKTRSTSEDEEGACINYLLLGAHRQDAAIFPVYTQECGRRPDACCRCGGLSSRTPACDPRSSRATACSCGNGRVVSGLAT